jgi:hypothetical protein
MADIRDPRLLYLKGVLLLAVGVLASGLLLAEHPDLKTAALLALAVWAFARAYYFAFYVIDHYVDPGSRYAGLIDFVRRRMRGPGKPGGHRDGLIFETPPRGEERDDHGR